MSLNLEESVVNLHSVEESSIILDLVLPFGLLDVSSWLESSYSDYVLGAGASQKRRCVFLSLPNASEDTCQFVLIPRH